MKPFSLKSLLLVSAWFTPWLQAQNESSKVREIEQRVLQKQYQSGIDALVGSASKTESGETIANPELIGKRVQWLTLVSTQIDGDSKASFADPEQMAASALKLNNLAWNLITSQVAAERHPEIALKLADMAIELGGEKANFKPKVLDTKARALFLLGKHDEAIAEQEKAIAAATVAEEKAKFEATLAAYKNVELLEVPPKAVPPASGVAYITGKLSRIVIPRIDFEDTTVEEAIDFLRLRAVELDTAELDPAKKGVNFVIRRPRPGPAGATDAGKDATAPSAEAAVPDAASDPGTLRVKELRIRNVPLAVALKYICDQTKLRYKVDDFAVTLVSQSDMDQDIFTRSFHVPPDFFSKLFSRSAGKAPSVPAVGRPLLELLKYEGINFSEGTSAAVSTSGLLLVTNTPSELDKIEQLIATLMPAETVRSGSPGKKHPLRPPWRRKSPASPISCINSERLSSLSSISKTQRWKRRSIF